ncbi:hypothetical protein ACTXLV_00160 [Brachybacterium alimentarium]|uniref:hypothetical protein n=1 Tax=Brachybacterium TaxID=43668 RepID=UPI003F928F19
MDAYRNEADRHAHLFRAGFALIRRGEPTMVAECSRTDGPATAVELGCGIGVEARFLAESGFTVHTVDGDASVERPMAALSAQLPIHHTSVDLAQLRELPPADLLPYELEILELTEDERDGRSFSGPKHWHTFRVIARRP